jgi:leucyl/phenylalanyl-tRNA---protein transferase
MIPWLVGPAGFPPVDRALREPNGLLAAGGQLTPDWLLAAYRHGIFPWYSAGEPLLWWSPDPRMVLRPANVRITRSLRRTLRQRRFEVRCDTAFAQVIAACAEPREPDGGTWITPEIQAAYQRMHELGYAHSVESWQEDRLMGGLYGMALGRVFFGESMFSRVSDSSKVALAHLARHLERLGYAMIDCQMVTSHLAFLGGGPIPREEFTAGVARWTREGPPPGRWAADAMGDLTWS